METFLNALIKNTKLAIIVIGLLLILMGAGGGFSKLSLTIDGVGWRVALFLMGMIVAGFGALLMWRNSNNDLEDESISADYALKIRWPVNGTAVDGHIKVVGTFQNFPPADRVWMLERSLSTYIISTVVPSSKRKIASGSLITWLEANLDRNVYCRLSL